MESFLDEIDLMKTFASHKNVIGLVAFCIDPGGKVSCLGQGFSSGSNQNCSVVLVADQITVHVCKKHLPVL